MQEIPLQSFHTALGCYRPPSATPSNSLDDHVLCRRSSDGSVDFDEVLSAHPDRVMVSAGGLLQQEVKLEQPPLKVGWVTLPCTLAAHDERMCILQERNLRVIPRSGRSQTILLPSRMSSFWPTTFGLLLTGKGNVTALLLRSFDAPYKFIEIGFPDNCKPEHIIWSDQKRALLAAFAPFSASENTISLWTLQEATATDEPPPPLQQGDSPSTQKRKSLRQPTGAWSPLAFRPSKTKYSDGATSSTDNLSWQLTLMMQQQTPYSECEVHCIENEDGKPFLYFGLHSASGEQAVVTLDPEQPQQATAIEGDVRYLTPVVADFNSSLKSGLLMLHKSGRPLFKVVGSEAPPVHFATPVEQQGLPYLNILNDQRAVALPDELRSITTIKHGSSNNRATLADGVNTLRVSFVKSDAERSYQSNNANSFLHSLERFSWQVSPVDTATGTPPFIVPEQIALPQLSNTGTSVVDERKTWLRKIVSAKQARISAIRSPSRSPENHDGSATSDILRECDASALPAIDDAALLLDSSLPVVLNGKIGRQGVGSLQKTLGILANRQLALFLGRGALGLQAHRINPTEDLRPPTIAVAAEIAEQNHALLHLDLSAYPAPAVAGEALSQFTAWPEFHCGVAECLSLASTGLLSRTWIIYCRQAAPSYFYGGMLLGLGLSGQLSTLSTTDTYRYLSIEHDPSLMGFLLGISAAKRCSKDSSTYKVLKLHHECPYLEIGPLTQAAAIFGTGLIFQQTSTWSVVNNLVCELDSRQKRTKRDTALGRNNGSTEDNEVGNDREMRTLAAGFAIGLILLGGSDLESRNTLQLTVQLIRFVRGQHLHVDSNYFAERESVTTSTIDQGEVYAANMWRLASTTDVFNLGSIVPASSVALGFMYLKTNRSDIADAFIHDENIGENAPHHLSIKILMRSLIMWDAIEPSQEWVSAQCLTNVQVGVGRRSGGASLLGEEAQYFCMAGASLALGIKYASTCDKVAAKTLTHYALYFLKAKSERRDDMDGEVLENCIATVALALSLVLAGSGDFAAFSLFRSLLKRVPIPPPDSPLTGEASGVGYGSYQALSSAIGFLFLSGGALRFGTSLEATAYLVISLFPILPSTTADNRYYLQALRHFYVMATQKK